MIDMLKRHEIQVLRRAGHSLPDVAKLAGVSVRSVQRVGGEPRVVHVDGDEERVRRKIGRPQKAGRRAPVRPPRGSRQGVHWTLPDLSNFSSLPGKAGGPSKDARGVGDGSGARGKSLTFTSANLRHRGEASRERKQKAVLGSDRPREGTPRPPVPAVPTSPTACFFPLAFGLLAVLVPPAAHAHDVALLPDTALHLEGARYAPSEMELNWTTWIGAGLGLVTVHGAIPYLAGDVETILGHERKQFDADEVNYHLEGGIRFPVRSSLLVPFFHHVSRHLIDRPKITDVDWNVLGLRAVGSLPSAFPVPVRYAVGVGHTVEKAYVTYEWELTARLEAEVWRWSGGGTYLRIVARAVTTKSTPALPREGFLDFTAEGGMRVARSGRHLDLFLAYEHRNDVFVLDPGFRDRALFGLRLASSPAPYLDPVWP